MRLGPLLLQFAITAALGLGLRTAAAEPSPLEGHWEGAYSRMGSVQLVSFDFRREGGQLVGTYDVPECDVWADSIRDLRVDGSAVTLRPRYGKFTLVLQPGGGELTGQNLNWKPPVLLHLKRAPAPSRASMPSEPVTFRNGDATLAGTLVKPASPGRHAAVVVVHGSGPQGLGDSWYRFWGEFFARRGVAALIFDKRGVGGSSGSWEHATFDDLAGDALAGVRALRVRADIDTSRVGLVGVSQGGWVAPLAAQQSMAVKFLILDVSPAVGVDQQELDRVRHQVADDGATPAEAAAALDYTRAVFHTAYTGQGRAQLDSLTAAARSQPWAGAVQLVESSADLDDWRRMRFDPAPVLRRTTVPVLALFGERDPLVPPDTNREPMERYLREAGNRDVTIRVIPGVGHDMTTFGQLRGGEWQWPDAYWVWPRRPVEFGDTIGAWLEAHGM